MAHGRFLFRPFRICYCVELSKQDAAVQRLGRVSAKAIFTTLSAPYADALDLLGTRVF